MAPNIEIIRNGHTMPTKEEDDDDEEEEEEDFFKTKRIKQNQHQCCARCSMRCPRRIMGFNQQWKKMKLTCA